MAQRGNRPKDPADTKGLPKTRKDFETVPQPGPGPKRDNSGAATKKHIETHRIDK